MGKPAPELELSVVLVIPDRYDTVRRTVEHLRAQTVRDRLELVLAVPSSEGLDLDHDALASFGAWRLVEVGEIKTSGACRAEAVRHAGAPLVVWAEDHCFPEPGWAEALIAVHRDRKAVVGPVFINGNAGTLTSWASFLMSFGHFTARTELQRLDRLPGHNSSYRREALLAYGSELPERLDVEGLFFDELRANGYELLLAPAARVHHLNVSHPGWYLVGEFINGRHFGAARGKAWSWPRRLLLAAAQPAVQMRRLIGVSKDARRAGQTATFVRMLPLLVLGHTASGLGEATAYLLGLGRSAEQKCDMEFHRHRFMTKRDRRAVLGDVPLAQSAS